MFFLQMKHYVCSLIMIVHVYINMSLQQMFLLGISHYVHVLLLATLQEAEVTGDQLVLRTYMGIKTCTFLLTGMIFSIADGSEIR